MKKVNDSKKIIYHKDSCITCKKTISEIQRMKIDIERRDFFKEPFSETELKKIIKMTSMTPQQMIRKRDKMYKKLSLDTKEIADDQLIKLMVKHPGLIARPIIIIDKKAHVGKASIENIK